MPNCIQSVTTQIVEGERHPFPILIMDLAIDDLDAIDVFFQHVADVFKDEKKSTPQLSAIRVMLMGSLTTAAFKERWRHRLAVDPGLWLGMDEMMEATVIHCKPDGTVISELSLL